MYFPPIVETYPSAFVCESVGITTIPINFEVPAANDEWVYLDYIISDNVTNQELISGSISKEDWNISKNIQLNNINLTINQFYKIQLRFRGDLEENVSEWSAPMYIRRISEPKLKHYNINEFFDIEFDLGFEDALEKERFVRYQIAILNSQNEVLEKSQIISISNFANNSFKYSCSYIHNEDIKVKIIYETQHGYVGAFEEEYNPTPSETLTEDLNATIQGIAQPHFGYIQVQINLNKEKNFSNASYFKLKRTDYRSNFTKYEEIGKVYMTLVKNQIFCWNDISAESGVFYKYRIEINGTLVGEDSEIKTYKESSICVLNLDAIFLADKDAQFKISFNQEVSGYKKVVTETVTNTLGSKYPFIKRNGANDYAQFTIGGTISFFGDPNLDITNQIKIDEHSVTNVSLPGSSNEDLTKVIGYYESPQFFSENAFYNAIKTIFSNPNLEISEEEKENILEMLFREEAIKFLNNGRPKIFKTATEKNMIIRLTNISFSPETQLGRRVWKFSATATEIGELTFDSLVKFNILTKGDGTLSTIDYNNFVFGYNVTSNGVGHNITGNIAQLANVHLDNQGNLVVYEDAITFYV